MKSKLLFVLASFFIFNISFSQGKKTEMEKVMKLRNKKKLKVGDNLHEKGSFYNAIEVYEMVLIKKPKHKKALYKLGVTNYEIRDYGKSAEWLKKLNEVDSTSYALSFYYLASSLKRLGEYENAKAAFNSFKKAKGKKKEIAVVEDVKKTIDKEIEGCDLGLKYLAEKQKVKIRHLNEINNPMSDYAPRLYGEKLMFSALNADTVIELENPKKKKSDKEEEVSTEVPVSRFSRIYESNKSGDSWSSPKTFSADFNVEAAHVGNGMYAPDGKSFVFTRCQESDNLKMICKIFISKYANGTWGSPVELGNGINQEGYNSTHPYLTKNASGQEVLYFSSDVPNGKGGMDIYSSIKNSSGEFAAPINLGGTINTAGNEVTPYFDAEKNKFYFSTDALVNIGGFDIYTSDYINNSFSAPQNIGYPLNSSVDDLFFVNGENDKRGFLVSNRPGGKGLKSPTCCDDILAFHYPAEFVTVQGKVTDEETGEPVEDCFMYVYTAKNDSLVGTFPIAKDGSFSFKLKADEQYKMVNSCKKYKELVTEIDTRGYDDGAIITKDIKVQKKDFYEGMVLGIVYYDYNKHKLRDESREVLDSIVNLLLTREDLVVRVEGHTDQRGSEEYNLPLSEKRAEAVYNYLIRKNVPKHKLLQVGYGESRVVEDCSGVKGCPETGLPDCDCHQKNRRTEFVLFQEVSRSK